MSKNFLSILVSLTATTVAALATEATTISLSASNSDVELGSFYDREVAVVSVHLVNDSDEPRTIRESKSSCGCTIAEDATGIIPPRGERTVKVTITPGFSLLQRPFHSSLAFSTDAGVKLVSFSGVVLPSIKLDSGIIIFDKTSHPGAETFHVASTEGIEFALRVAGPTERLDITLPSGQKPARTHAVSLIPTASAAMQESQIDDQIDLRVEFPGRTLLFPVAVKWAPPRRIVFTPEHVNLAVIDASSAKAGSVTVKDPSLGTRFVISRTFTDSPSLTAKSSLLEPGLYRIDFSYSNSATTNQSLSTSIHVITNETELPEASLRVIGAVRGSVGCCGEDKSLSSSRP